MRFPNFRYADCRRINRGSQPVRYETETNSRAYSRRAQHSPPDLSHQEGSSGFWVSGWWRQFPGQGRYHAPAGGFVAVSPVAGVRGVSLTTPAIVLRTSAGRLGQASTTACKSASASIGGDSATDAFTAPESEICCISAESAGFAVGSTPFARFPLRAALPSGIPEPDDLQR